MKVPPLSIPELDEIETRGKGFRFWTEHEEAILARYYGKVPTSELAKHLPGRSTSAIGIHAGRMGISWRSGHD